MKKPNPQVKPQVSSYPPYLARLVPAAIVIFLLAGLIILVYAILVGGGVIRVG